MQQKEYKKTILGYIRIWLLSLSASIKRSNTYKGEIFVRIFRTFFILFTQILLLSLVFGDQEVFVGWTKNQAYLVMGIWNLLNYTGWALFGVNLSHLEEKVLNGDFDYVLLKPLSSAWFSSFSDFSLYNWISSVSGVLLIGYYFVVAWNTLTVERVVLGIAGILIGLVLWYAFYLLLASFSIANPRNGFLALAKEILGLTKYPINIFSNSIQFVFYTLVPIAFVSSVPANLFIGRGDIYLLIIGVVLSIAFLRFALWVWEQNVKKYTSAGG